MTIDRLALTQRSLLGGVGGLLGWASVTVLVTSATQSAGRVMFTGALIGGCLGASCGVFQGLFRDRSRDRALRGAAVGAVVGLVGGAFGLLLGEQIFTLAGGGLFPRALGWGLFGALVGIAEGVAGKMPQKIGFGAFGGLLGGLFGGSTYEFLASGLARGLGLSRDLGLAVGGAVGLVLLGMFIGAMISLVEDLFRAAWLLFTSGRFEGQTRTLDPRKRVTSIGRSEMDDICILGDPEVAAGHCVLVPDGSRFQLEAQNGKVLAGKAGALAAVQKCALASGDYIQIGSQRAQFRMGEHGR